GGDKIAMGVLRQPLQRHRPAGCRADEAFQLIAPRRRELGVGGEGKPVDTGAVRTSEPWHRALLAKARAETAPVPSGACPPSDSLLAGGGHRPGERRLVIPQRILSGGHGGLHARFQIAQPAERTDDPPAALLDHRSDGCVRRWLPWHKTWLEALACTIAIDPLQEEHVIMHMHIQSAATALDKRDRLHIGR